MNTIPGLAGYPTRLGTLTGRYTLSIEKGSARRFEAAPPDCAPSWHRWSEFGIPRTPESVARGRRRSLALAPGALAWFQRVDAVRDGEREPSEPFNVFVGMGGALYVTPAKVRALRRVMVSICSAPDWAPAGVELWGRDVFGDYWGGPARNFSPDRLASADASASSRPAGEPEAAPRVTTAEDPSEGR